MKCLQHYHSPDPNQPRAWSIRATTDYTLQVGLRKAR